MAEFDEIDHTGGSITIRKGVQIFKEYQRPVYQTTVQHMNPWAAALQEYFVSISGKPVELVGVYGLDNLPPEEPTFLATLLSDREGLFGRQCPKCSGYFRTSHTIDDGHCPYCPAKANAVDFITPNQRQYFEAFAKAFANAPLGETTINLDELTKQLSANKSPWIYAEQQQQRRFRCSCVTKFDVLGEYVRCPSCGKRTNREVASEKFSRLQAEFDSADATIPATDRQARGSRWVQLLGACISDFDSLGNDLRDNVLMHLPATPRRRRQIRDVSFQNILKTAESLQTFFAFDILDGVDPDDRDFLNRMFNRRHLFTHNAGIVDAEYLQNTGDTTVKLAQLVRVDSKHVKRLIPLVRAAAEKLIAGCDSIQPEM